MSVFARDAGALPPVEPPRVAVPAAGSSAGRHTWPLL
jgi:hypothetical protein